MTAFSSMSAFSQPCGAWVCWDLGLKRVSPIATNVGELILLLHPTPPKKKKKKGKVMPKVTGLWELEI